MRKLMGDVVRRGGSSEILPEPGRGPEQPQD
jgi:hypothetical protein